MAIINYSFRNGKPGPEENLKLTACMNKAHFRADRYLVAHDQDVEILDGEVHAGYIPILFHKACGNVSTVTRRSPSLIRKDSADLYLLSFPLTGSLKVIQSNRTTPIHPGDCVLTYANAPVTLVNLPDDDAQHESLHVLASSSLMARLLLKPQHLCGSALHLQGNGGDLAQRLLVDLYRTAEDMDTRAAQSLATSAIEAILLAAQDGVRRQAPDAGRRERSLRKLLDHIALHCFEPDLSARKVAEACGISTRYLHDLLQRDGKSFHALLWQARLASAKEQLEDRSLAERAISEVAYLVGFKSTSHFSRAFRAAYGLSPRALRQKAGGRQGPAFSIRA